MPFTRSNLATALDELQTDVTAIADTELKKTVCGLLNLIETLSAECEALREENQQLNDEINRLKGEQGKPEIKGKTQKQSDDHSSEKERKADDGHPVDDNNTPQKTRQRTAKLPKIIIDREQICSVDKNILPADAQSKGYSDVVIQDIKIVTDNVKYRREVYYSPSLKQTFLGKLPADVAGKGEFGVGVRSLIPLLKSECNLSESCILDFFQNFGIVISSTYISNQWTQGYLNFEQEKADIVEAGLASTTFQHIDDTSARVNGENHYTHILCNPFYAAYFTTPRKDRLTVLDVLTNHAPRHYLYNAQAIALIEGFQLSEKIRKALDQGLAKDSIMDEQTFDALLNTMKPGPTQRTRIKEACAIAAYREQTTIPVIEILMCDDAPQFKLLTKQLILCWIHDGRHYKKLKPVIPQHQALLDDFRTQYWRFYHRVKAFKENPDAEQIQSLSQAFDTLFSTQTGYVQLDQRIAKTKAKRKELLLVLQHPELPLHNNPAELAARVQARKRDVSFHTMSEQGTRTKDAFMTVSQTAKKLSVRTYEYIRDRVSAEYKLPSLAELIREKSGSGAAMNVTLP